MGRGSRRRGGLVVVVCAALAALAVPACGPAPGLPADALEELAQVPRDEADLAAKLEKDGFDAAASGWLDVRAFGAVGDGVADDTAAFKAALASGAPVVVPRPPAFYRITSRLPVRGSVRGVGMPRIVMEGASGTFARAIMDVSNIRGAPLAVTGLHLDGGWSSVDSPGEQSHGVAVRGSSDVTIALNVIENTKGDSIYVGSWRDRNSERIDVRENRLSNAMRCNVAVVAGVHVSIDRNALEKRNAYVAVIDVEPGDDSRLWAEDVQVRANEVTAPAARFVHLCSPPPSSGYRNTVSDILVLHNRARAASGVVKKAHTGSFHGITVVENEFFGTVPDAVFFAAPQASNGATTRDVTVRDNVVHVLEPVDAFR